MKRLYLQTLLRQLATATRHGVPARDVASVLGGDDTLSRVDRAGLSAFAQSLAEGHSVPRALRRATRWLSPGAIDLLEALEVAGDPEASARALELLANDQLRQDDDRRLVAQAWRWPLVLAVALCGLTLLASLWVLPAMDDVFTAFGLGLPAASRVVMGIGIALPWILLVAVPFGLWLGWSAWRGRMPAWVGAWGNGVLAALPARHRQANAAFAARMREWLAAAPRPRAAELALWRHAAQTAPLPGLSTACTHVAAALAEGRPLDAAMGDARGLPVRLRLFAQLAARSPHPEAVWLGARDELERLADDAGAALQRALTLLLYLATASLVGYVMLAIYVPIFKAGQLT